MITSAEDGDRALREHALIDFVPRALNALPLVRSGAVSWLVCDESPDAGWAEAFGVRTWSLEEQRGVRRGRIDGTPSPPSDVDLGRMELGSARAVPASWRGVREPPRYRATAPGLFDELTDKARMRALLARFGVPVPECAVLADEELRIAVARRRVGLPFVLQRVVGKGGWGTYLVHDEDELRAARAAEPGADRWLISEFLAGTTLNFHCLVSSTGSVTVTRPSLQFTGIAEAGADFGAYCGCDFQAPQRLPAEVDRARAVVRAVGDDLAALGYRGVFGVDVLVHDGSALVVEVNARTQGSTWLLGEIERAEGRVPLLVRHVLERYGWCTDDAQAPHPAAGAQLGIRHRGPAGTVTEAPRSGVHALDGDRLVWRRPGFGLLECADDECVIVGVPRPGREVLTTGSLGILVTRHALARDDGHALTAAGSRLVAAFHDLFTVDSPDAVADEVAAL